VIGSQDRIGLVRKSHLENTPHARLLVKLRRNVGMRRFFRDDRGQSMVELGLLAPLLVFILLGGADLARAYAVQLAVQNGARAGAEAYAISATPTAALAQAAAVAEMNRTPTVNATSGNVVVSEYQPDGSACVHPPMALQPCYVSVAVTYTFHTTTAWPFIPNTANFFRGTEFRVFY
jgi:Flp pilus assembly protein TadG